MQFDGKTLGFLTVFLATVLLAYYLLPTRIWKYRVLLVASWGFYVWLSPGFYYLGVILFTTIVDYYSGLLIESAATPLAKKRWLWLSIISNLGFLAAFKYTHFAVENVLSCTRLFGTEPPAAPFWLTHIALPLGISFHTFQGISYTLDVSRGKIRAVRSFTDFALFVAFFPQLVAGPIVRAVDFLPQMAEPPRASTGQVLDGMHWFLLGLFKKVFLADQLGQNFVDPVFGAASSFDSVTHFWAVLAWAGQIYCDFSGYSDMAIGIAQWFGFELPRNFDYPYLSSSITDFWKRWHISLSSWMRDYVYISLGGNRRGTLRTYLNLLATLTLCGLWHGASWNFILWGFYNGVLLALHRVYEQAFGERPWMRSLQHFWCYRVFAILGTFLLVAIGLVMVRAGNWSDCWGIERSLVGLGTTEGKRWVPVWVPLLVGMVVAGHLFSGLRGLRCAVLELPSSLRAAVYVAAVVLLVAFGPGVTNAFFYFRF